jgi:hypothetical protein
MTTPGFYLGGDTPYPVFNFGANHIHDVPSGTMINGTKYPARVLDPLTIFMRGPEYKTSRYLDEDSPTTITYRPEFVISERVTSSPEACCGKDEVVRKVMEKPEAVLGRPIVPAGPIVPAAGGILFFVPSSTRPNNWDALLHKDTDNLYSDFGPIKFDTKIKDFRTLSDALTSYFSEEYSFDVKFKSYIDTFYVPDILGTHYQIFICCGEICHVPENMMLFPLSGMTNKKQIGKECRLDSYNFLQFIPARLAEVIIYALENGKFEGLLDKKPYKK